MTSHWPHSLIFLPFLFIYIYIFKSSFLKDLFIFSSIFIFYESWNYISLNWLFGSKLSKSLSNFREALQSRLGELVLVNYPEETGQFVNYLLFNKKTRGINTILGEFHSLSITHLLVVSGMHMNLVKKIVQKVESLLPLRRLRNIFSLTALAAYSWATGFSSPSSRVFLEEFSSIGRRISSPIVKWSKSVWLSFLLFPQSIKTLSFALSYFLSLVFRLIDKLNLLKCNNLLLKISVAFIFSSFMFSYKTGKIFPLGVLNQLFLSPIVIGIFLFFLFTWPFKFLSNLGVTIYSLFKSFIGKLSFNKLHIQRGTFSHLEPLYFGALFSLVIFGIVWLYKSQESEQENSYRLDLATV